MNLQCYNNSGFHEGGAAMPMDEFAWRVRLARRRKAHRRKFMLAAALIVVTILVLAWYLAYYIQRPAYALEQAAEAAASHDAELFLRRVDVAAVADAGCDDLTYVLFARDTSLKETERNASGKFYEKIKDSVASGIARTITDAVRTGEWAEPEGTDELKGRQLGIDFEYLMECSHLRECGGGNRDRARRWDGARVPPAAAHGAARDGMADHTCGELPCLSRSGADGDKYRYLAVYQGDASDCGPL